MSSRFPSIDKTLIVSYLIRSYPIIFSNLNMLAIDAANTIMVSRISVAHAASAVLANTLFNIFKKMNSGISVSVALLVARSDRKKNYKQARQILTHGLLLNTFFALVFSIILMASSFYLDYASKSAEMVALGRPYLQIISFALIPAAINNMIKRYLEGLAHEKIAFQLSFFTLITNLMFNFLLIYGPYGMPSLGLNGAGIAIVLSEIVTAIAGGFYLICIARKNEATMVFKVDQISWRYFRKIVYISWPIGLQFGIEGSYMLLTAIITGWISIEAQAGHAILFNICQIITIFAIGLALSGSILVTQQHSPTNGCLVRKVAFMAFFMIAMVSIVVGMILSVISPYIIGFYQPGYIVHTLVSRLISHLSIFQLFYGVCYWGNSILRGLHDNIFLCFFNMITQFIGVSISYILVVKYNKQLDSIWMTLILKRILLSLFLLIRFGYKTKTNAAHISS